ncbi:transketolase [Desulfonatronum lacustre]|uniref:transketolase n=1 Tax=Desulfonatronum lacustre TaxID=66849 RepID=UPI00048FE223|nr:transketolase [Desulfonatronum lacustre]
MAYELLEQLSRNIRSMILTSTTRAGSGHPSSSLSATELMVSLLFGGTFRFSPNAPEHPNNDRLIFSKGHAAPLLYALWAAAGKVSEEEILSLRTMGSALEGHPTPAFPYTEASTGSLGQGLSIGLGMALNAKFVDKLPYRTFVLLGDSEMTEGSQWEAIQLAAHYRLDNLIGILDVNRLGQRGQTMYGHDLDAYAQRIGVFGWQTITIEDGHDLESIGEAYREALVVRDKPAMIIARTLKGRGVALLENREGWHGKPVPQEEAGHALAGLGAVDYSIRGEIQEPEDLLPEQGRPVQASPPGYERNESVATRKAYGNALARLSTQVPGMVVLDAEVSNSTYADFFAGEHPERFFEMFVAEQNMVGAALGLSLRGKVPFVSTFAAFLTRAFDQIRMSRYSGGRIVFCGSHAGVSIGEDGTSQMGLEDLAMFRTVLDSVVLYPSDAMSTERLVEQAAAHEGISYIRTTRQATPVLYGPDERFPIGGSKVLIQHPEDKAVIIAAGITLHEALAAADLLEEQGVLVRVIDCYSIKPLDRKSIRTAARETGFVVTVEDHYAQGGLGEAVAEVLVGLSVTLRILAVRRMPRSGKLRELLDWESISRDAIIRTVREGA